MRGRRIAVDNWKERLRTVDGWVVAVYAEDQVSLWLYSALSDMWGYPSTGGLVRNLKRARDASVLYEAQWEGSGLRVALCDQDPALEGGLSKLTEQYEQFLRKEIKVPPGIVRTREIRTSLPDVDAIMLPASPIESNSLRLALARVLLIRPEALEQVAPDRAFKLESPNRLALRVLTHGAADRMASLEDPPGRKLWAAPRLGYFLARRRIAQAKDWLRWVFIEKPAMSLTGIGEFFADLPKDSLGDLMKAMGFLSRSLLEGWAEVLVALAVLIGALSRAGLL